MVVKAALGLRVVVNSCPGRRRGDVARVVAAFGVVRVGTQRSPRARRRSDAVAARSVRRPARFRSASAWSAARSSPRWWSSPRGCGPGGGGDWSQPAARTPVPRHRRRVDGRVRRLNVGTSIGSSARSRHSADRSTCASSRICRTTRRGEARPPANRPRRRRLHLRPSAAVPRTRPADPLIRDLFIAVRSVHHPDAMRAFFAAGEPARLLRDDRYPTFTVPGDVRHQRRR